MEKKSKENKSSFTLPASVPTSVEKIEKKTKPTGPPPGSLPKEVPEKPRRQRPVPADIKLSARQYVRAQKIRWDKAAGFLHDMKKTCGPDARKTRADWNNLWNAYWARPVK